MCSPANIMMLNIGGTVFHTSKATLTGINGFFKMLLESDIPLHKDESNCIFIDRSPKHFDVILNFLRDGDVDLPELEKEVKEVRREAQFYLLDGLVYLCNWKLNTAIHVLKNDTEKLEFQRKNDKPRLLIKYGDINDVVEYWRLRFNIPEILEKYGNKLHIAFQIESNICHSTLQFKEKIRILTRHPTEDPYEEFTGFVDEFLAEIVADSRDNEDDSANSEGDAHNQDAALI
ncbi:BTB domain-containing protein [Caenorhabditis elegans]|uniref:BTB domain-containing protein n=1 Tax=Caenorhabditis elegans TaxID=6239 RepID=Q9TZA9_CAEEL|nr:BTB domain-containing protein [Caenorhabditis elegans]CCD66464.1 BTB domain-containing protein [Caenorhabditis elegans]|eukprot:NP_494196.2 Uncharacterized protein CELE_C40A11.3 [Caenorhabditis elegans]